MSKKIIDSLLECGFITIDEDYAKDMTPKERKDAYDELIDEVKPYYPKYYSRTYQLEEGKLGLPVPYEWNGDQSTEILIWTDYNDVFEYGVDRFVDHYESDQGMMTSKVMEEIINNGFMKKSDEKVLEEIIQKDIDYYENVASPSDLRDDIAEIDDDMTTLEENLEHATDEYDDEYAKYLHYEPIRGQIEDLQPELEYWVDNTDDSVFRTSFPLQITEVISTSSQFKKDSGQNMRLYVPFESDRYPYTINEFASLMVLIYEVMDLLENSVNPSSEYDAKLERMIFSNPNDSRNFQDKLEDRVQALSLTLQADLDSQALFQKMRFNDDFNKIFIYIAPYDMIQTILSNFGIDFSMEDIYLSIQALLDYENTNGEYYEKGQEIIELLGDIELWNQSSELFGSDLSMYGRFTVALLKYLEDLIEDKNLLSKEDLDKLEQAKDNAQEELDNYDPYSMIEEIIRGRYEGYTAMDIFVEYQLTQDEILEKFGGADLDAYARYVLRYQLDEDIASYDSTIHDCEDIYYIYV